MREIGIEELKRIQLDMLLSIHDFCMNNGIDYSLAAGTLIGAIRHKGYIPWDDDVDILMTRPNYDKFLKSFNGYKKHLEVIAPELNWNYYAPYANVFDNRTILFEGNNGHRGIDIGIKIDIFPIDGAPNNPSKYMDLCDSIYFYNRLLFIKRHKGLSLKHLIGKLFLLPVSYTVIQKRIHKLSLIYDYCRSDLACLLVFDPIAFRAPRSIFENYTNIEFEGHEFMTVKDYDLFMILRYGDYMKLPPIEEQIPTHNFSAYWKDNR